MLVVLVEGRVVECRARLGVLGAEREVVVLAAAGVRVATVIGLAAAPSIIDLRGSRLLLGGRHAGLSLTYVRTLLFLTITHYMAGLLIIEAKVILPALVPSRIGPGYIKDHRVASIRRGVILGATGRLVLVLGRAVRVLGPGPESIITKPVDILLLLQAIIHILA